MERLFARLWPTKSQKMRGEPGYVALEDLHRRLLSFAHAVSSEHEPLELGGSLWGVGLAGHDLLLPAEAAWLPKREDNIDVYKYLILCSLASRATRLSYKHSDRSRIEPRLWLLRRMVTVNQWLDEQFSFFSAFQREISQKIKAGGIRPEQDFWWELLVARTEAAALRYEVAIQKRMASCRLNEVPNSFLHALVPLPYREIHLTASDAAIGSGKNKKSTTVVTEKSRKRKEFVDPSADKKEKQLNPVMHSFEKIETLDDYSGEKRVQSGDDELESHNDALSELELNRSTSDGDASSVYRQDLVQQSIASEPAENAVLESTFPERIYRYAEWHERERSYRRDHCTLYEVPWDSSRPTVPAVKTDANILTSAEQAVCRHLRYRLTNVFNRPLWVRPTLDGPELDIDRIVMHATDGFRNLDQPKIFAEKRSATLDLAIAVLVDHSLSTDSWIGGKRVMDTVKAAMAAMQLVSEGVVNRIRVDFSMSQTRHRISYRVGKDFKEDWLGFADKVRQIQPAGYTRLGPAIRHVTRKLIEEDANKLLLFVVTDGKPTDLDPYEGRHGQEDVRMAVREASDRGLVVTGLTYSDMSHAVLGRLFDRLVPFHDATGFATALVDTIEDTCF